MVSQQSNFSSETEPVLREISSNEDWEIMMKETKPILLQASATWCRPCQVLKPKLEKAVEEQKGSLLYYYMDVEKNQQIA